MQCVYKEQQFSNKISTYNISTHILLIPIVSLFVCCLCFLYFPRPIYDSIEENCSHTQNIISNYSIN